MNKIYINKVMQNNFNVFVDEVKNVVSNYPVEFANLINAGDITKITFRDVEKVFLGIPSFADRRIVMMAPSSGSNAIIPPKFGQDTPLTPDINIYIFTDKNDLIKAVPRKNLLIERDRGILKVLKIFLDNRDMYMETAKSGNSWSYIDREKYTPGAESQSIEYKPLDTDLFRTLIDKYMDKVTELRGPPFFDASISSRW